ncbi:MAG: hypothetical protein CMG82_04980 [Marinobacter sp.]|nr:hypothetical protein [Marinobacter sp.]
MYGFQAQSAFISNDNHQLGLWRRQADLFCTTPYSILETLIYIPNEKLFNFFIPAVRRVTLALLSRHKFIKEF